LLVLKESKNHIICSWLLLLFFVAGQVVLYSHHHEAESTVAKVHNQISGKTVSEKCGLCDAMRFNSMEINQSVSFNHVLAFNYFFLVKTNDFLSISIISSAGRSPPLS
jgi:hypothetical protein